MLALKLSIILLLLSYTDEVNIKLLPNLKKDPDIHHAMIKLLKTCFVERLNTVIVTKDLSKIFQQQLMNPKLMSHLVIIDTDVTMVSNYDFAPAMASFVFTIDSANTLTTILEKLKLSNWWNIDGLFLIVETTEQKCQVVFDILLKAWQMNLLTILYLCNQVNEGIILYTFNPYTDRAPYPWKKIENGNNTVDQRWTLYKQVYTDDHRICASLDYDKTKFLNGYKIKVVSGSPKPKDPWIPDKDYDLASLKTRSVFLESSYMSDVLLKLNVTAIINYDHSGYLNNGEAYGFVTKLINGTHDVAASLRDPQNDISFTYPLIQGEVKMMTQRGKFLSPWEKIINFYSTGVVGLSCLVFLITFLVLLNDNKKQHLLSAALDVVRLILSHSIKLRLKKITLRIYFFLVWQLIIILNATFQGNISAFLTKPERRYIDTIKDLENNDYHIYVPPMYESMLHSNWTLLPPQLIHIIKETDCQKYIVNNSAAACIGFTVSLLRSANGLNLHISRDAIVRSYLSQWCRDDWPLLNRFNSISSRLMQSGLLNYWKHMQSGIPLIRFEYDEAQEIIPQIRKINLNDMEFGFHLFAYGIILSTVVFVIEIIIHRIKAIFSH